MNLALEYLLRTQTIRGFLKPPCSLFVQSNTGTVCKVLTLEEASDRPTFYSLRTWHLGEITESDILPKNSYAEVKKSDVFTDERVILPGFRPMQYFEQAVTNCRNNYRHPMEDLEYNHFVNHFLNSGLHRAAKNDWLWLAFVRLHFGNISKEYRAGDIQTRFAIERQQSIVREYHRGLWLEWNCWRDEIMRQEEVAPELVFKSAYAEKSKLIYVS